VEDGLFNSLASSITVVSEGEAQVEDLSSLAVQGIGDVLGNGLFDSLLASVTVASEDEVQAEDLDSRALQGQGLVMSNLERNNAGYIQTFRKQRGLQALTFSPDLVVEAQRWSKVMARQGHVANRDPGFVNIALPWKRIGEVPGKYNSVALSGAASHLKSHPVIMDGRYNRIGVGIVKSAKDGAYYVTVLLKEV
jgi:uncharacterized protein YkwD